MSDKSTTTPSSNNPVLHWVTLANGDLLCREWPFRLRKPATRGEGWVILNPALPDELSGDGKGAGDGWYLRPLWADGTNPDDPIWYSSAADAKRELRASANEGREGVFGWALHLIEDAGYWAERPRDYWTTTGFDLTVAAAERREAEIQEWLRQNGLDTAPTPATRRSPHKTTRNDLLAIINDTQYLLSHQNAVDPGDFADVRDDLLARIERIVP